MTRHDDERERAAAALSRQALARHEAPRWMRLADAATWPFRSTPRLALIVFGGAAILTLIALGIASDPRP